MLNKDISMNSSITKTTSPEEQELEIKFQKLHGLETDLLQKELKLSTLKAELQAFELHYLQVVGVKLARLDDIHARVAEFFAKVNANDENAMHEAREARTQADETARAAGSAQSLPEQGGDFKPSSELKSLYREAARAMHPDLALDDTQRKKRTGLMADINIAYATGDEERIRQILRDWKDSPDQVEGDDVGAKLIRAIRRITQLQRRLTEIQAETNLLKQSDLYQLSQKAQEAKDHQQDILEEMAKLVEKQIADAEMRLDELTREGFEKNR
jgi:hypothetical protein